MGEYSQGDPLPFVLVQVGEDVVDEPEGVDLVAQAPLLGGTRVADHALEALGDLSRIVEEAGQGGPGPEAFGDCGDAPCTVTQQVQGGEGRVEVFGEQLPPGLPGGSTLGPDPVQRIHAAFSATRSGWTPSSSTTAWPSGVECPMVSV